MSGFDDILKAAPAEERAIVEKYLRAFAAELEADVAIISRSAQAAREELAAARAKLAASEEAEKALKGELAAANAKLATTDAPSTAEALERLADAIETGVTVNASVSSLEDFIAAVRSDERAPGRESGALRSRRAVVIWVAVAAIILAAVFPPWSQDFRAGQGALGYAPIWSPPDPAARFDLDRLLIEWALVGSIAAGFLLTLEEATAFVCARWKALRALNRRKTLTGIAGVAVCVLLVVAGQETHRQFVTEAAAWTAYSDAVRKRCQCGAKVSPRGDPSSVLVHLSDGRYRASSFVESPEFVEGRLYFSKVVEVVASASTSPVPATSPPQFVINPWEWDIRKAPGGPTVELRPKLNLKLDQLLNLDLGGPTMTDQPMTNAEQMITDGLHTGTPVRLISLAAAIRKLAPQFNYSDVETVKRFATKNPHLRMDQLTFEMPESAPVPNPQKR